MIRAPESPSFAVRRGCDHPGELGLGGAAVHHVVALAQTKTKKSSTSPAAESSKQRAGIGVSHLLLCHRDRSAIHQDATRTQLGPFSPECKSYIDVTADRAEERAAPVAAAAPWGRRGSEGAGGRESEYIHSNRRRPDGRTRTDAVSRNPVSGEARTDGEKRRGGRGEHRAERAASDRGSQAIHSYKHEVIPGESVDLATSTHSAYI